MNKNLYIIEDDAVVLYTLRAKFSSNGFVVDIDNGSSSIAVLVNQLKNFKPAYIILDLMLPEIEGADLLRVIKGDEELKSAKVIIYTNMSDKDTKEQCENLGADYYFVKSDFNNLDEFAEKICKLIKNKEKK